MSVAEKLTTVAENMPKVFEAGKDAEYKTFWNTFLSKNDVMGYAPYLFAGSGWKDSNFKPNKNLKFVNSVAGLFRQCEIRDLTQCLESCGVTLDLSTATNLDYAFAYNIMRYIPKVSVISAKTNLNYIFAGDSSGSKIIIIDELEVAETNTFKNSFNYCNNLEHVIFTGTLATSGLDLHWSTKLDRESLLSIIGVLQDKTSVGGTWTVTLGSENLAKLTDAEKAIATQKGWTLV